MYLAGVSGVSSGECNEELLTFMSFSKMQVGRNREVYKEASSVCQLAFRSVEAFHCVSASAERLLVSTVSTVDCQRGFNRQNLIKTDHRNRMSPATIDNLMRLSTWNRDLSYDHAFRNWANSKDRRILG